MSRQHYSQADQHHLDHLKIHLHQYLGYQFLISLLGSLKVILTVHLILHNKDKKIVMNQIQGDYCYFLNSDDLHDTEIAMTKNSSDGGTLVLWKKDLDPYVSV